MASWSPGNDVDYHDYHQDTGQLRTVPVRVESGTVEIPPDELEIPRLFRTRPELWTVAAMRQSRWQQR